MVKKILIVEDEQHVRETIAGYLGNEGYEIIEAVNGQEGLKLFEEGGIDLVITDVRMPVMNGIDLLKIIKSMSPATPVIVMTGYVPIETHKMIISLRASAFLVKPFSFPQLKKIIESC